MFRSRKHPDRDLGFIVLCLLSSYVVYGEKIPKSLSYIQRNLDDVTVLATAYHVQTSPRSAHYAAHVEALDHNNDGVIDGYWYLSRLSPSGHPSFMERWRKIDESNAYWNTFHSNVAKRFNLQ